MFSRSTRSSVYSAMAENETMSPTTMTMSVTAICRTVSRQALLAGVVNRRERNCSSAPPRRTRSPGLIRVGVERSIRYPLSRVPFVLRSVSQA
jgi:hypothetical protein